MKESDEVSRRPGRGGGVRSAKVTEGTVRGSHQYRNGVLEMEGRQPRTPWGCEDPNRLANRNLTDMGTQGVQLSTMPLYILEITPHGA